MEKELNKTDWIHNFSNELADRLRLIFGALTIMHDIYVDRENDEIFCIFRKDGKLKKKRLVRVKPLRKNLVSIETFYNDIYGRDVFDKETFNIKTDSNSEIFKRFDVYNFNFSNPENIEKYSSDINESNFKYSYTTNCISEYLKVSTFIRNNFHLEQRRVENNYGKIIEEEIKKILDINEYKIANKPNDCNLTGITK